MDIMNMSISWNNLCLIMGIIAGLSIGSIMGIFYLFDKKTKASRS